MCFLLAGKGGIKTRLNKLDNVYIGKEQVMKKLFISIICVISCLTLNSLFVLAEESDMNQNYVNIAQEVVQQHVVSVDTGEKQQNYNDVSTAVDTYLSNKEAVAAKDLQKNNYNVETSVVDYKVSDGVTYIKINVIASWNYVEDIDSGYGKDIDVLIDNATGKVIDVYEQFNEFDNIVRGDNVNILNANERLTDEVASVSSRVYANKMKDVELMIEKNIEDDRASLENKVSLMSTNAYSWIYHDDVVAYARANYNKDTPARGNASVPYYDFSEIPNNYDCTNFVSHALLKGSARVYDTGNPATGWYYWSLEDRSYSWSGVIELYNFVTNNTTKGPGGYSMTWNYNYESWSPGDIMQFHNGSKWIHSTVITNSMTTSAGKVPLVTGRTGDGAYNNNQTATSVYGSNAKRILHLYNYGA